MEKEEERLRQDRLQVIDEWMHTAFEGMGLTISEFWTNLRLVVATLACLISFHAYFGSPSSLFDGFEISNKSEGLTDAIR